MVSGGRSRPYAQGFEGVAAGATVCAFAERKQASLLLPNLCLSRIVLPKTPVLNVPLSSLVLVICLPLLHIGCVLPVSCLKSGCGHIGEEGGRGGCG